MKKIIVFGGSFNPPCKHHIKIAKRLTQNFDLVIIIPCGPRSDKLSANAISAEHRGEMSRLAFKNIPKAKLDLFDVKNELYTPAYLLQEKYQKEFPKAKIWHFIGSDIIVGGADEKSEIHRTWKKGKEIWKNLNFLINERPGYIINPEDLPPKSELSGLKNIRGSATEVRNHIKRKRPVNNLVTPEIIGYIQKHNLYEAL